MAGLAVGYHYRGTLLPALARLWIVDEKPEKADAILVLGGGVGWRPLVAARLYTNGYAAKVLVINNKGDVAVEMGLKEPEKDLIAAVLESKGVPKSAIVEVGNGTTSTFEDVKAARDWAETTHATRILIPTDIAHSRRAGWTAKRLSDKAGIQSRVLAFEPPEYAITNWWTKEEGLIAFQNEFIKFGMYLKKY